MMKKGVVLIAIVLFLIALAIVYSVPSYYFNSTNSTSYSSSGLTAGESRCGDNICSNARENCSNCPADCGVCPASASQPTGENNVTFVQPSEEPPLPEQQNETVTESGNQTSARYKTALFWLIILCVILLLDLIWFFSLFGKYFLLWKRRKKKEEEQPVLFADILGGAVHEKGKRGT